MVAVARVKRHRVVVHVHSERPLTEVKADLREGLAGVLRPLHVGVDHPHGVFGARVHINFRVVGRAASTFTRGAFPGRAVVVGLVEAHRVVRRRRIHRGKLGRGRATGAATTATACRGLGINQRIHAAGLFRVGRQCDTSHFSGRQTVGQLCPVATTVGGLEDAAIGTAANHLADVTTTLVGAREDRVRVARVKREVREAGVLVDVQHTVPGRATVGRLVDAAVAAGRKERALRGDPDDVRVVRIDQNLADVLGVGQARPRPRLAGVGGLVEAVAKVRRPLALVFTRAEPKDVRVLRINHDAAHVVRRVVLEDGLEAHATINRLPDTAERRGDVPDVRVFGIDGDVLHPSRHDVGGQGAPRHGIERVGGQPLCGCLPRRVDRHRGHECHREYYRKSFHHLFESP